MGFLALGPAAIAKRLIILVIFAMIGAAVFWAVSKHDRKDSFQQVDITGIHHLGPNFNIDRFYVNGYDASNVGRSGGGGKNTCCVLLPKKWRPGLFVDLRWSVGDWSKENVAETEVGNYRSLSSAGAYRARVPVERYVEAEHLFVHFFPNGRARVVSSFAGRGNPEHPIQDDDVHAAESATAGVPADSLFTPSEMAERKRRAAEDKRENGAWQ